ncbi:MAG: adenylate cyclase [Acidimicrobiia bacterium]
MTKTLDDAQLSKLLTEMNRADSVELKLTVPDHGFRSAVDSLDLDPLESRLRQVIFFDTPELTLYNNGVVVRSRRIQGGAGDTVVKLRPLPTGVRLERGHRPKGLSVEVDAMPGGFVCSGSIKRVSTASDVRKVALGNARIGSILSKGQKDFFHQHAPAGLRMRDLSVLGPITLLKLKFNPKTLGRPMAAELWMYPDGSRILELSTKSAPSDAFQVAATTRAYLADHGIDLTAKQQTKTKTALKYFASGLASSEVA